MSVDIETVTVGGDSNKRMVISNSQVARVFSIGSNWTTIRFFMRVAVDDSGANFPSVGNLYMGIMANPDATCSNGPASATCPHFYGIHPIGSGTRTLAPSLHYNVTGWRQYRRVGASLVQAASTSNHNMAFPAVGTDKRGIIGMVFQKTGGNIQNAVLYSNNTAASIADLPDDAFLEVGSCESSQTIRDGYNGIIGSVVWNYTNITGLIAVDEATNGFFNAFVISWPYADTKLHLSGISWRKFN